MKKIEIEIPEGCKEVINRTENGVMIEWIKVNKEQEMRNFLKPFLTNLLLVKDERYPDSVFYKQGGEVIFELEKTKTELRFWVDYHKIWSVFTNRFGLNYYETKPFIKNEMEETLNLRGITPKFTSWQANLDGRDTKFEGGNTSSDQRCSKKSMEDTLNLRGITPINIHHFSH